MANKITNFPFRQTDFEERDYGDHRRDLTFGKLEIQRPHVDMYSCVLHWKDVGIGIGFVVVGMPQSRRCDKNAIGSPHHFHRIKVIILEFRLIGDRQLLISQSNPLTD